jgi:hypothetical protein
MPRVHPTLDNMQTTADMGLNIPSGYSSPAYPNTPDDQAGPAVAFVVVGLICVTLVMLPMILWIRQPFYVASLSIAMVGEPNFTIGTLSDDKSRPLMSHRAFSPSQPHPMVLDLLSLFPKMTLESW